MVTINYLIITIIFTGIMAIIFAKKKSVQNYVVLLLSFLALVEYFFIFKKFSSSKEKFEFFRVLNFEFSLEPIGAVFILMALVLWLCNNLYSISYFQKNKSLNQTKIYFYISISVLFTILIGLSKNLLQTFILYEILTISTYPLVANNFTPIEKQSSGFYIKFLMTSSMFLFLPALLFLQSKYGNLEYHELHKISANHCLILSLMFIFGISKAAIVPMHFWLPKAMVAPIPVSALLHAVAVVKSGIFILIKIFLYVFGLEIMQTLPKFLGVNIVTIVIAISLLTSSIIAVYQNSLKKLLAYSTINQLSICLLSLSLFNKTGVVAAVLHMLSHAMAKITLFFGAGYIHSNTGISDIDKMSGIAKRMPFTCLFFMICALSIIGIPLLAGFISKSYIMVAAFEGDTKYFAILILAVSILFTANYFVRLVYRFYIVPYQQHGNREIQSERYDSTMLMAMLLSTFMVLCFFMVYQDIINLLYRTFE